MGEPAAGELAGPVRRLIVAGIVVGCLAATLGPVTRLADPERVAIAALLAGVLLAAYLVMLSGIGRRRAMERELRTVRDDLIRVNRVSIVNAMASTIAHEVNQPLAAANNFTLATQNWLAKDPPDLSRARESLAHLEMEVIRARDVVEEIRGLSAWRESDASEISVDLLVRDTISLVEGETAARGVSLQMRISDAAGSVHGRKVQLQQVLLNLLNNALEAFDGDRTPAIVVSAGPARPGWIRISVTDNGPGIAPDKIAAIHRGLFTTKPGGTGLGVAICRQIVEAHGGIFELESGPGGTTVTIHLLAKSLSPDIHAAAA